MEASEIVQLVGWCVAFVVGTIVFLVTFFRGMSWLDVWIRKKNGAETSRRRTGKSSKLKVLHNGKHQKIASKNPYSRNQAEPQKRTRLSEFRTPVSVARARIQSDENAPRDNGIDIGKKVASEVQLVAPISLIDSGLTSAHDLVTPTDSVCELNNRIATVHLMSGEIIEGICFASREETSRNCERLGFSGIVLKCDDGMTRVVREANIKMITLRTP